MQKEETRIIKVDVSLMSDEELDQTFKELGINTNFAKDALRDKIMLVIAIIAIAVCSSLAIYVATMRLLTQP